MDCAVRCFENGAHLKKNSRAEQEQQWLVVHLSKQYANPALYTNMAKLYDYYVNMCVSYFRVAFCISFLLLFVASIGFLLLYLHYLCCSKDF